MASRYFWSQAQAVFLRAFSSHFLKKAGLWKTGSVCVNTCSIEMSIRKVHIEYACLKPCCIF